MVAPAALWFLKLEDKMPKSASSPDQHLKSAKLNQDPTLATFSIKVKLLTNKQKVNKGLETAEKGLVINLEKSTKSASKMNFHSSFERFLSNYSSSLC